MSQSNAQRPVAAPEAPVRNPWLVLLVVCTGVFMLLLDTTVVNNAQVKIRIGLGATLTEIQWVLDSYILTYAVLLLSFGRLGDVFGRKKLFMLGMAFFTAASGLCALSGSMDGVLGISGVNFLIFSRVLQGVGGAFMMPQSLTLVTVVFPAEKRGAALGIWGSVVALGAIAGPVIGGLIVTNYAWEWVFLINLPIGIAALIATVRIVPESRDPLATKQVDWGGVLLSGFGIFAVVFALIEGNTRGWTDPLILGSLLFGFVLLAVFIWWEQRAADPMMKLELFKIRNFWVSNAIAMIISFGMLGIFFPMTIFLQSIREFTPIRAGLTMAPMSVMILFAAPLAGRLVDRIGARWILFTGTVLMSVGILLIISQINPTTTWQTLLIPCMVTGLGMGLTFSPMTAAAMREVPPRIAGSASGILNTTRNLGQVLGIAVLGSLLQSRVGVHVNERVAATGLEAQAATRVTELAKQSQFEKIAEMLSADQVTAVFAAVRMGFIDSLHNTFLVGAATCMVAAGLATLIRNPRPVSVAVSAPVQDRPSPAAAD